MAKLLPHIPPNTPAEPLAKAVDLSDEGKKLLRDGDTAEDFLLALIDADEVLDAIRLVAGSLHPQYAVAWALDCAGKGPPFNDDKKDKLTGTLFDMTQRWLDEPGDTPLRREAMVAAEECGYFGAPAWVAAAVGWSGGSIAPISAPPLEPPVGLCARAASGAIIITACADAAKIIPAAKEFLELGLEYAQSEPPKGAGPTRAIDPKPAQSKPVQSKPEPRSEPTDNEDPEERPVARSLRRSPGAPIADPPKSAPPPPPAAPPRSLRPRSPGQSGSSGSGWGSSPGDKDSGGGWNPKPL